MRGTRSFNALGFPDMPDIEQAEKGKGRSEELLMKRDIRLCHRVHYYANFTTHKYETVLELLEAEFEISVSTITQRLQLPECATMLQQLKKMKPDLKYFRQKYGLMVWAEAHPLSKKGKENNG